MPGPLLVSMSANLLTCAGDAVDLPDRARSATVLGAELAVHEGGAGSTATLPLGTTVRIFV